MRPLGQLQHLEMGGSRLAEVPAAVAALTALTQLSLGRRIWGGWHYLRPLAQLRCFDVVGHVHSTPEALAALAAVGSMHPTAVECMLADSATANLNPLLHLLNDVGFPEHLTLPLLGAPALCASLCPQPFLLGAYCNSDISKHGQSSATHMDA